MSDYLYLHDAFKHRDSLRSEFDFFNVSDKTTGFLGGFKKLNVFIGPNNSRKSRLMREILLLEKGYLFPGMFVERLGLIKSSFENIISTLSLIDQNYLELKVYNFNIEELWRFAVENDMIKQLKADLYSYYESDSTLDTTGTVNLDLNKLQIFRFLKHVDGFIDGTGEIANYVNNGFDFRGELYKLIIYLRVAILYKDTIGPYYQRLTSCFSSVHQFAEREELSRCISNCYKILNSTKDVSVNVHDNSLNSYVPILRTTIKISESDLLQEILKLNYPDFDKKSWKGSVSTGLDFYGIVLKYRNGKKDNRINFDRFERFVSSNFFPGHSVDIVASVDENTGKSTGELLISIGKENDRPIHNVGDGIQALLQLLLPIFLAKNGEWFFIEEPEINLHPGMLRLFIDTILNHDFLTSKDLKFFLTTHSNHFLDLCLENNQDVSIFKLEKENNQKTKVKNIYEADNSILNILGVPNGTVLLANCSIWLEGITDRKYIKAFLNAYQKHKQYDARLKEDMDYCFFEYAGSNLVHYDFSGKENESKINAKKLANRIFLISDKDGENKEEKHRALENLKHNGFEYSVTHGREVENYISPDFLKKLLVDEFNLAESDLKGKKIDEADYKNIFLSEYIDKKFPKLNTIPFFQNSKKRKGTFSTYYKNKIADYTFKHLTWDQMSKDAQILTEGIFKFIRKDSSNFKLT